MAWGRIQQIATNNPYRIMPLIETIYGDIEEGEIQQAREDVALRCPPVQEDEQPSIRAQGRSFQREGSFLITGPEETYPDTRDISNTGAPGHRQGYKIHVAALPTDAAAILDVVNETLQGPQCPWYKVDSNVLDGNTQPGKFITVYAKDPQHLEQQALKLQKALFDRGFGPHKAVTPGGAGCPLLGSGDKEIGSSGLMTMRFGAFMGDKRGNHKKDIWVPDKTGTGSPGWVKDDRTVAHNHQSLKADFDHVVTSLDGKLQRQWQQMVAQQQEKLEKRGARILPQMVIPDSTTPQAGQVKDSMPSRATGVRTRHAAVRFDSPPLAANNNNNQPHEPTVQEMLHRQPLVSQAQLNAQRAKMGLPPPPPSLKGGGGPAVS